jgi:hypothetical protein
MSDETENLLLIEAWQARDVLYKELFGDYAYSSPKTNLPPSSPIPGFKRTSHLEKDNVFNPNMSTQRIAVLTYAPNDSRPYWMYITSGLSNPWYQDVPSEVSGFGTELIVKTKKDARWPIQLLRRLAYYILSYTGTLSPGKILNMSEALTKNANSKINNILVWYEDIAPDCWYQLPSGGFGIFATIGITEDECRFAESVDYGPWCIQQVLRQTNIGQITDPDRDCVMKSDDINNLLDSLKAYASNFKPI